MKIGHDDDGEKYGGKTVEKVLVDGEVVGVVVVARWYGGVMLGPVRFEHIRRCAGEAVGMYQQDCERSAKRVKAERRKEELVRLLPGRDASIAALRGLLAEKTMTTREKRKDDGDGDGEEVSASTPRKVHDNDNKAECEDSTAVKKMVTGPDYATMPLATLEKLESVRDATIGWILKQIEKAEEGLEGSGDVDAKSKAAIPPSGEVLQQATATPTTTRESSLGEIEDGAG